MISVLFLIPTLDRGGAENVLVDLVNHMNQNIFQITVQTLFDKGSQKGRLRKGIEYRSFMYYQFPGNSRLFARIPAGFLYRLIVRKQYDIVVSYLEGPTTHIVAGCPYTSSKTVSWVHVEMNSKQQASVGFKTFEEAIKAYGEFDRVVFVAKTVQESFRKITGRILPKERVLYNTIDTRSIIRKSQEMLLDRIFSGDEFNIISVGRIIPAKGFDRLARVHKSLVESGYRTHIYILGEGREQNSLEAYVKENALTDSFTFLGFRENPYQIVAKADLFVCSSRREGFSTAVTEALVLGVPIVSTRCSGADELLGNQNEYGIVTDNSEEALLEGIKKLLDNADLLRHYRKQARIRGESFHTENTVRAVESMLTKLAGT